MTTASHQRCHHARALPGLRGGMLCCGLVVVLVLAGCASREGPGVSPQGSAASPQTSRALLPTDFPVNATPRPLVLTGPNVRDPATGFVTGDQKMAYINGNFSVATPLPSTPVRSGGWPVLSAAAALKILRVSGGNNEPTTPLPITAISLATASFDTDRGPSTLPTWEFQLAGVAHPAYVLAVDPSALWPEAPEQTGSTLRGTFATSSADGKSITLEFSGAPAGPSPCGATYRASTKEAASYVEIFTDAVTPNPLGHTDNQGCLAMTQERAVVASLKAPLGDRILVDSAGRPITVTTSAAVSPP